MTDREKLKRIVEKAAFRCLPSTTQLFHINMLTTELIANGVTIQRWIPVTERLPEEQGFYRVYHKNSKAISDRFYYKDCPDLFANVTGDPITHWKPIEQPPKEVE